MLLMPQVLLSMILIIETTILIMRLKALAIFKSKHPSRFINRLQNVTIDYCNNIDHNYMFATILHIYLTKLLLSMYIL